MDADKDGLVTRAEWDSLARIFEQSQNALLAIRPDGTGDVTTTHIAWKQSRGLPYVPSPLYYDGRVYLVKNGGVASFFEARDGKGLFIEERLGLGGEFFFSTLVGAGAIFLASRHGTVVGLVYRH